MDNAEIIKVLTQTHNQLSEIWVRREDTLRMASAITNLRGLIQALSSQPAHAADDHE